MRIRKALYFCLGFILLGSILSSCGPSPEQRREEIEKSMKFWVGKSETELVAKWGPPSNVYDLTDGSKEITYRYVNRYYGPFYGGWAYRTERGFTVDTTGTIIAYRWDGF